MSRISVIRDNTVVGKVTCSACRTSTSFPARGVDLDELREEIERTHVCLFVRSVA